MTLKDIVKWNTRVSAVYAIGIWTLLGSYAFVKYTGLYDDKTVKGEEKEKEPNPNEVVHQTAHSKTVIVYKSDFIPYTTRVYNFIQSFSSQPGDK